VALAPDARFCAGCGAATTGLAGGAVVSSDTAPLVEQYHRAAGRSAEPQPDPEALARYERLFAEFAEDGVIEADEADELLHERRKAGIPDSVHARLMEPVFPGIPVQLRFDVGQAHFVVGEMAQLALEIRPRAGEFLRSFEIFYRCTIQGGDPAWYRHPGRVSAQGMEFTIPLQPPSVAGQHTFEGVLVAAFTRAFFRARFNLPRLMFDPAVAAVVAPQHVTYNMTNELSGATVGGFHNNVGAPAVAAPRNRGGVQLGACDWRDIALKPLTEEGAHEWLTPRATSGPPLAATHQRPRLTGTPLRCRGIYLNLWRANERPQEIWWLREERVVFGRMTELDVRPDVNLTLEPATSAGNLQFNPYISRHHLALRRTDQGVVCEGLTIGTYPAVVDGRRLTKDTSHGPLSAAEVTLVPGLALSVSCWRDLNGVVDAIRVARRGNVEIRSYLLAGRGLGLWPDRAEYVGLRADGAASAPVALIWHEGAPAVQNVSCANLLCDKVRVAIGDVRYLAVGQLWTMGALNLEVTDEMVREKA
jgi:hypothetical protein